MGRQVRVYEVGGVIRDRILGIPNKDIDFAVEAKNYAEMREFVLDHGKIFMEQPQFFTIRAHVNSDLFGKIPGADFVLCRKEGNYTDGRRPDKVYAGTIYDDLARRDFTMNAIAVDVATGEVIDPYNGLRDIEVRTIRCVGDPKDRFLEDALRMLRALRFSITKDMYLVNSITNLLRNEYYINLLDKNISEDRKRDELYKMFKHNTLTTMEVLCKYPGIMHALFSRPSGLWLKPTNEGR